MSSSYMNVARYGVWVSTHGYFSVVGKSGDDGVQLCSHPVEELGHGIHYEEFFDDLNIFPSNEEDWALLVTACCEWVDAHRELLAELEGRPSDPISPGAALEPLSDPAVMHPDDAAGAAQLMSAIRERFGLERPEEIDDPAFVHRATEIA